MKSIFASVTLLAATALAPSASACCLFPFFPTYSAGYGGWGWGAPAYAYNYAPASYAYNYAPTYTAAYAGFAGSNSCCAPTSCCQTSCGSSCGSGVSSTSDCGASEILKRPIADPGVDRERSFGSETDPRDKYNTTPRTTPGDRSPLPEPADTFDRTDRTNPPAAGDWGSRINERSNAPLFENDLPAPGSGLGGTQGANKPVIKEPVDEEPMKSPVDEKESAATDAAAGKPVTGEPAANEPTSSGPDAAKEVTPKDFLAPETSKEPASARLRSQFRSSHADVLPLQRLAGVKPAAHTRQSQLSTSDTEVRPARWISVPLPVGQARL